MDYRDILITIMIILTITVSVTSLVQQKNTRENVIENGCGKYNNTTGKFEWIDRNEML